MEEPTLNNQIYPMATDSKWQSHGAAMGTDCYQSCLFLAVKHRLAKHALPN